MGKIAVIGRFTRDHGIADGQTIKTLIFAEEIENALGKENVIRIDTNNWKRCPLQLAAVCVKAVRACDHVAFLVDEGGIKVFPWLLWLARVGKKCRLHYVVVGGWLPHSLETRKLRRWILKKLDGIYVETSIMKNALAKFGLTNVDIVRNCKRLPILKEEEMITNEKEPFKVCTFSRVMREKGIQDAVEAVRSINQKAGRVVYTLDIYGQVDDGQVDWFEQLKAEFPEYVRYGGTIAYHQSVDVLKNYFALLYPTKLYYIEGVPGTIIDAYAAGVPVIASRWASFDDVLDEETCVSYSMEEEKGLLTALERAAEDPTILNGRKKACLQHAQLYTPEAAMQLLFERLRAEG